MAETAPHALPDGYAIDVVRGTVDQELADELVAFWTDHRALSEEAARRRAPEVICVLRGPEGAITAVNSAYEDRVEALGGRLLWVYRSFAATDAARAAFESMFSAAAESLGGDYRGGESTPWGLYLLGGDPPPGTDPALTVWPVSGLILAGYTEAGSQIRVRYFPDPTAPPFRTPSEYPMDSDVEILPIAETDLVSESDVVDFWRAHKALPPREAERRAAEVCTVGLTPQGELAGLSTAYLAHNERLRTQIWHVRVFVGEAHRKGRLGTHLNIAAREYLMGRYLDGVDTRAPGIVLEIEELMFERQFPWAVWPINGFTFIGLNPNGAHVRVSWFPGSRVGPG